MVGLRRCWNEQECEWYLVRTWSRARKERSECAWAKEREGERERERDRERGREIEREGERDRERGRGGEKDGEREILCGQNVRANKQDFQISVEAIFSSKTAPSTRANQKAVSFCTGAKLFYVPYEDNFLGLVFYPKIALGFFVATSAANFPPSKFWIGVAD